MLRWWFETLGETMTFDGKTYPRYLLWHPRDHIHWELVARSDSGGTGQGARFRIVEAFAANPAYYVDSTEYVEKLDEEGTSLVRPRVFSDAMGTAWLVHNVEEVSMFENFLPSLYAAQ